MGIPDTTGLGLDDDEMQRRAAIAGRIRPSDSATGPPLPPAPAIRIPSPSANDKTSPATLRGITPQLQQRTASDEAEAKRIQDTGSGISQIQHGSKPGGIGIAKPHPIFGGFLRGLDILGSVVAPGITANIPGTELHHQLLGQGARGRIGSDIEEQGKEATTAHTQQETANLQDPQAKDAFQLWKQQHPGEDVSKFYEAEQGAKTPNEADKPLANVAQLNQALTRRFQVLNPGKPLPPEYTLPANATNGDYARINESLKNEEGARGTAATQASAQADRENARSDRASDRSQREADREESRQDRLSRQSQQDTSKHQADRDKFVEPLQAAIDNADLQKAYAEGGQHTGPQDYQMMLQFQEAIVAGQKAGIRFNTAEQARIEHARSLMDSLGATVRHATVGTYFSEQQRKEISEAMQTVSAVHQKQIQRWDREHGGGGQAAASSGNGKTLTMTAIQQAAKDHGVSVDEAKRQAQAAGYNIQ